ncbi:MAG: tRNA (adenosine(37)-N6)-dimethylallyltransferase MiaA [Candidatus Halichondribacter symbioticus]
MTLPQTITQTLDASAHPILLTGATASGKSQLGLDLARRYNGAIINADALQVYRDWRILSARPDAEALAECPHYLYGHLGLRAPYSVGHWLDEVREVLERLDGRRAIILGGTGLYFNALTKGLSTIPAIPDTVRAEADELAEREGAGVFARVLRDSDPATYARIDVQNPARTRRGWEVLMATGRGLSAWHADGTEAILPAGGYVGLQMCIAPDVLNARIDARFDTMVAAGALEECAAVLASDWDAGLPSCQTIGGRELVAYIRGECALEEAVEAAKTRTRQYAKRQRTWLRNQMAGFLAIND